MFLTGKSRKAMPKKCPFLVKKQVLSIKLTPHPIISLVVNVGPYGCPFPDDEKEFPSSP